MPLVSSDACPDTIVIIQRFDTKTTNQGRWIRARGFATTLAPSINPALSQHCGMGLQTNSIMPSQICQFLNNASLTFLKVITVVKTWSLANGSEPATTDSKLSNASHILRPPLIAKTVAAPPPTYQRRMHSLRKNSSSCVSSSGTRGLEAGNRKPLLGRTDQD